MSVEVMEEEMASLRNTALAIPALAVFMGIAAMAAPVSGSRISNAPNAEKSLEETAAAGVQLAVISGAAAGFGLQSVERPLQLTLVKQKLSDKEVCAAKCRKAYRYCYSRGEQALKPQVPAEPCTEEKVSCLRACAKGSQ